MKQAETARANADIVVYQGHLGSAVVALDDNLEVTDCDLNSVNASPFQLSDINLWLRISIPIH